MIPAAAVGDQALGGAGLLQPLPFGLLGQGAALRTPVPAVHELVPMLLIILGRGSGATGRSKLHMPMMVVVVVVMMMRLIDPTV